MEPSHLHRIDPEANMARFYSVAVAPNLFGEVSILRCWGRIGTFGRMSIQTCATVADAQREAAHTLKRKMRRGYREA